MDELMEVMRSIADEIGDTLDESGLLEVGHVADYDFGIKLPDHIEGEGLHYAVSVMDKGDGYPFGDDLEIIVYSAKWPEDPATWDEEVLRVTLPYLESKTTHRVAAQTLFGFLSGKAQPMPD